MTEHTRAWLAAIPGTLLWRKCHRLDGTPKVRYTEGQARRRAATITAQDGEPMRAYKCPVCSAFHVGAAH